MSARYVRIRVMGAMVVVMRKGGVGVEATAKYLSFRTQRVRFEAHSFSLSIPQQPHTKLIATRDLSQPWVSCSQRQTERDFFEALWHFFQAALPDCRNCNLASGFVRGRR